MSAPASTSLDARADGAVADDPPAAGDSRVRTVAFSLLAGLCLAASVPPWGWWPLAFVGVAIWDRLIAEQPWRARFGRTWIVCAAWLFPAMLWMWDLTPPGYVIACISYAAYFGTAVALAPGG